MNRKQADVAAGVLVSSILFLGIFSAVQLQFGGGAMSDRMASAPIMATFGPVIMSLVVASIITGVYVFVRGKVFSTRGERPPRETPQHASATARTDGRESDGAADRNSEEIEGRSGDSTAHRELLDVLPDDERRLLEPVIESPGLTQIELRDRSNFSKSKVSQSITDLEQRGLVYREPQGRTYRVFPADDLDDRL